MKRVFIIVVVTILLCVGCSNSSSDLIKLKAKNQQLENELNEYISKYSEIKSDYTEQTDKFIELKNAIFSYFEAEHFSTITHNEDFDQSDIDINSVRLFMTQEEVKKTYGEDYTEKIVYEAESGQFLVYWSYADGTLFKFNPNYLVSMKFSNPDIKTNMGIHIGSNAKETLAVLDSKFTRYSNIHNLDNSIDIFDFYYDVKSNTVVHVLVDDHILHMNSVKDTSVITEIRVVDYDWDFYN